MSYRPLERGVGTLPFWGTNDPRALPNMVMGLLCNADSRFFLMVAGLGLLPLRFALQSRPFTSVSRPRLDRSIKRSPLP